MLCPYSYLSFVGYKSAMVLSLNISFYLVANYILKVEKIGQWQT